MKKCGSLLSHAAISELIYIDVETALRAEAKSMPKERLENAFAELTVEGCRKEDKIGRLNSIIRTLVSLVPADYEDKDDFVRHLREGLAEQD